jgi:hypothetical protein
VSAAIIITYEMKRRRAKMKKMVVLMALILAVVGLGSNVFADFNGIVLPELPYTYNGHTYNAGISCHYYPNGLYAYALCEVPFDNLKLSNQAGGIVGGCPAGSWLLYSGWSYSNAFTPMNEGTGGLGFGYTSNPGGASNNYIQTSQDILSDDMQSVYFKANLSSPYPSFSLIHDLPYQRPNGITYTDVIATRDDLHTYYAYYDIPVNGSIPDITRYGFDWGISFGCNGPACSSPGYHLYMITCDQNNNNCVDGYDTGTETQVVGSSVGQPTCWDNDHVYVSRGFVWYYDYSGLCGVGDVTAGSLYGSLPPPPPPSVTAPLHDENDLIMTTSDYSNFATREYFNVLRINHSGVDLALSPTGARTASQVTAGKSVYPICDGTVEYIHNGGGLYSFAKIRHPNCNGQEVVAYYGHIAVIDGLTDVTTEEPIGTVKDWRGNSHLHLTIDTQTDRNLSRINQVVCDYSLDNSETVTSLSNCSNFTGRLENNRILLRIGWGQVKTMRYKDSRGKTYRENLYLSEDAVRELGFMSFFDFYE